MVSKVTDFEVRKSLYPLMLLHELLSGSWSCTAGVLWCDPHFPTPSTVWEAHTTSSHAQAPPRLIHQSSNVCRSKWTEEGRGLPCHRTTPCLLLRRQFWDKIPFYLVTNTRQVLPDRRNFKDAACSTDWGQPHCYQAGPLCPAGTCSLWKTDTRPEVPSSAPKGLKSHLNKNVRAFFAHLGHLLN